MLAYGERAAYTCDHSQRIRNTMDKSGLTKFSRSNIKRWTFCCCCCYCSLPQLRAIACNFVTCSLHYALPNHGKSFAPNIETIDNFYACFDISDRWNKRKWETERKSISNLFCTLVFRFRLVDMNTLEWLFFSSSRVHG